MTDKTAEETQADGHKSSIKDAINYAIDLIYELNSRLPEPLDNPFEAIDNMECELTLLRFRDHD